MYDDTTAAGMGAAVMAVEGPPEEEAVEAAEEEPRAGAGSRSGDPCP
jgi:hypothetical protein